MAGFATTAWCFRSSLTDLAIEIKHFPKLSWRWRTQESRGPPASASASTTRPARSKEYKIPHTRQNAFLRCLYTAPCAKFLRLWGKSELGVSVSSPSLTSDPIFMTMITMTNDHVQGSTTTSSERTASRCTLVTGTQFSTTTPASPHGFGTIGRIRRASLSVFLRSRPCS